MDKQIEQKLNELINEITASARYTQYSDACANVEGDNVASSIITSYKLAAKPLQEAAIIGVEVSEDKIITFNAINTLALTNDNAINFISAEVSIKTLMAEIIQLISAKLNIKY